MDDEIPVLQCPRSELRRTRRQLNAVMKQRDELLLDVQTLTTKLDERRCSCCGERHAPYYKAIASPDLEVEEKFASTWGGAC